MSDRTRGPQRPSPSAGGTPPAVPAVVPPALPKGGGAIRTIGETFAANPVTGTATLRFPLPLSPGRAGFGPQLALAYDSGSGNGPFGLGWSLGLPAIARRTDRQIPRYDDARESDTFVLSGADDLVPLLEQDPQGAWAHTPVARDGFLVHRYRPRVEGLFARIERWVRQADGDTSWRTITRDNVTTWYGRTAESRISDPADTRRIFTWLICQSYDDKGNAVTYEYVPENGDRIFEDAQGQPLARAHERNRTDPGRGANRYLKRIRYGNRVPNRDANGVAIDPDTLDDWMFEAVLDYDDGHYAPAPAVGGEAFASVTAAAAANARWPARQDPFSTYRAGFEVRTYRLCRRLLMFHRFPQELGRADCLVRAMRFDYEQGPVATYLTAVTESGYELRATGQLPDRYLERSFPPVELDYQQVPDAAALARLPVETVAGTDLDAVATGAYAAPVQWVDLDGEGAAGILSEHEGAWLYRRNTGASNRPGGNGPAVARFEPAQPVGSRPALAAQQGNTALLDLAGDGQLDFVALDPATGGFHEHAGGEWSPFQPFASFPNLDTSDPNVRMLDLDGDGIAEILVTADDALTWYPALGEAGFGPAVRQPLATDDERGPRLVFSDASAAFVVADFSGDGATDLARITNGGACYWPNLGYGRFGPKVTMDNAPTFDAVDRFDPARIQLADTDGSGVADLIYLGSDCVSLWLNQSGNGWGPALPLPQAPLVEQPDDVQVVDLLGAGTACLTWTSRHPDDAGQAMRYIDLMAGRKPHLLVGQRNNMGAEVRFTYASSTAFAQADRLAGTPWVTQLPFPVHVLERVETIDHLSGNRFVTRYAYHHGHFDGPEREFRGFGMVEQWDTETFATVPGEATPANLDPGFAVPPVLTKTWYHTGIALGRDQVSTSFAGLRDAQDRGEYYREPSFIDDDDEARRYLLDDTVLPAGLTPEEERESCRALKGTLLHQEIYALDGAGSADHPHGQPYIVSERNLGVVLLQPRGPGRHAVFFTHPREGLEYQYDRVPHDPRIRHTITLDVDPASGEVRKELAITYGRRDTMRVRDPQGNVSEIPNPGLQALAPRDRITQGRTQFTYTEHDYTNPIDDIVTFADDYRTPRLATTRTWDLTGFAPENGGRRFSFDEWARNGFARIITATEIPYEQVATHLAPERRLVEAVRTRYRRDDLTAFLPFGALQPLALAGESYQLALTPGLVTHALTKRRAGQPDEALLPAPATVLEGRGGDEGGYVALDGMWWVPAGQTFYDPAANAAQPATTASQELATARQHFFVPRKTIDPFGQATVADYDGPTNPALPRYDLFIRRTTDPAGNVIEAAFDYRVLLPATITDPNGNRESAMFDALAMVTATATMGKSGETRGDLLTGFEPNPTLATCQAFAADPLAGTPALLGQATLRFIFDLHAFRRAGQPPYVAEIARETHVADLDGAATPALQVSFTFGDGFGRLVQEKRRAEPGLAPQRQPPITTAEGDILPGDLVRDGQGNVTPTLATPRWVGTGRTVYNNKGKPVRKYEPFFSATHLYEPEREMAEQGVSPVLFYDPIERVVATVHPNHTYEKVIFAPWSQTTFDQGDTVAPNGTETGDPRTDPDIAGFVRAWFDDQPATWATWFAQRSGNQLGAAEADAAQKATAHANTPSVAHLDALSRPFLTVGRNRVVRNGVTVEEESASRVAWDIEGNQLAVDDALGRVAIRYDHDLLGRKIHQASMDAGERWFLVDVAGNPIRTWDSRGVARRLSYDALRRPTDIFVTAGGVARLDQRTTWGEAQGDGANHRTRVFQVFDGAGVLTNVAYDFKGNLAESRRDLLPTWDQDIDWSQNLHATDGSYVTRSTFDALNRPHTVTTPDDSVLRPGYNEAGLLDRVEISLRGAANATAFVTGIDYDPRGQRLRIAYGNGATTTLDHDPETFRVSRLRTTRPANPDATASQLFADPAVVQDLVYTYDPLGNVTRIADVAQRTVTHNGQQVDAVASFTYDAFSRLVEATGREHIGQAALDLNPAADRRDFPFAGNTAAPGNLQALRSYTERYNYDLAGNIEEMRHVAAGGGWTRAYVYDEPSLLDSAARSNRLTRTEFGNGVVTPEAYVYVDGQGNDVNGCVAAINAMAMTWDASDRLRAVDLGGGGTAHYVYDAEGRRVRKVIASQAGTRRRERVYVGDFEVYREFGAGGVTVNLERESLHILDGTQRIALVETLVIENGAAVNVPAPLGRYELANHLGTAAVELDDGGALISFEECTPFGTTSFQAGRSAAEVNLKRYRFTGKERDEETGFSYHGARYFVPWVGRWSAPDPLGVADDPNLYAYVHGNPIAYVDEPGTDPKKVIRSDNYRLLLRQALEEATSRSLTNQAFEREAPRYLQSRQRGVPGSRRETYLNRDPALDTFRFKLAMMGRETTKLADFTPPGWEEAGGNPAACFRLACAGAGETSDDAADVTKGGGVILYEATAKRIKTDKTASDVAIAQIKRHIDAGRAVVTGISEPDKSGVVDATKQPVTDHFVAVYGYETDVDGKVIGLLAKDNAVANTAEIRFIVGANGAITKPKDTSRTDYIKDEYQVSEVRFHKGFEYTGTLRPTNDAGKSMVWPLPPDPPKPPPPQAPK